VQHLQDVISPTNQEVRLSVSHIAQDPSILIQSIQR
jgi:hypothetical protein